MPRSPLGNPHLVSKGPIMFNKPLFLHGIERKKCLFNVSKFCKKTTYIYQLAAI
jgi:hypothetical protein